MSPWSGIAGGCAGSKHGPVRAPVEVPARFTPGSWRSPGPFLSAGLRHGPLLTPQPGGVTRPSRAGFAFAQGKFRFLRTRSMLEELEFAGEPSRQERRSVRGPRTG